MNQPFYTRDGVKIEPGMLVYCKGQSYPNPPDAYVVDSIADNGKKVLFANTKPDGYEGARVDGVFSTLEACNEAVAKTRVKLDLEEDDAHLIIFALSKQLKQVKSDLAVLRIAKDRDLTKSERCMLPNLSIFKPTREQIAEQIDPWISLEDEYEYLIKTIVKAKEQVENYFKEEGQKNKDFN